MLIAIATAAIFVAADTGQAITAATWIALGTAVALVGYACSLGCRRG